MSPSFELFVKQKISKEPKFSKKKYYLRYEEAI
jgi:hypothetical protein